MHDLGPGCELERAPALLCSVPTLATNYFAQILGELPRRLKSRDLALVYSSDQHGFSQTHLLQRLRDAGQTVLVLEDTNGHVSIALVERD